MTELALEHDTPIVAIVGDADDRTVERHRHRVDVVSLSELFGEELAMTEPRQSIQRAAEQILERAL
jgi:hypothetical protein